MKHTTSILREYSLAHEDKGGTYCTKIFHSFSRLSDAEKTSLVLFGYDEGGFYGNTGGGKKEFLKAYDKIELPPFYCCKTTEPYPSLRRRQKPTCGDVQAHLETQERYGKLAGKVPFSDFGRFEKRLRALDW